MEILHYAERIEDCRIVERGMFFTALEFLPYRKLGWSGSEEFDGETDALIEKQKSEVENKDYKFPETDWSLCNHMDKRRMVAGMCSWYGLFMERVRCMAPGVRSNAICPPIKKYIKDRAKIKREAQK